MRGCECALRTTMRRSQELWTSVQRGVSFRSRMQGRQALPIQSTDHLRVRQSQERRAMSRLIQALPLRWPRPSPLRKEARMHRRLCHPSPQTPTRSRAPPRSRPDPSHRRPHPLLHRDACPISEERPLGERHRGGYAPLRH